MSCNSIIAGIGINQGRNAATIAAIYHTPLLGVLALFISFISLSVSASPTISGQTGLVSMPSARLAEDGDFRLGVSYMPPYAALWSSLTLLPRLEVGARYTSIDSTRAISSGYGTFKDKAFDAKLLLLRESEHLPAVSVGSRDYLGTRVFASEYLVASKRLADFDVTLGYGQGRINGLFGGLEYFPRWSDKLSFGYEYDATDYSEDHFAADSGAEEREGGHTLSLHYGSGWLGAKLALQQDGSIATNLYLKVPLMQKEFIPKIHEPPVYSKEIQRTTVKEWRTDPEHRLKLRRALEVQGFKNVRLQLVGRRLELAVSHNRISLVGRTVGRAARTALLMGPVDLLEIQITYFTLNDMALISYEFTDLALLDSFFSGQATYNHLFKGMTIRYAHPSVTEQMANIGDPGIDPAQTQNPADNSDTWVKSNDENLLAFHRESTGLDQFNISPFNLGLYFNDAGGALRYETFAMARYRKYLGTGLFFSTSATLDLWEDVSQVEDSSNSLLPHVRSDVADYKRDADIRLESLLVNKYTQLKPRLYSRLSIGYYEAMFGGVGGQILYFPKQAPWAVDVAVDHVSKRATDGGLDLLDYQTTTAIASLHYRVPDYGLTFTLRGGQFLARDRGARFEIQRRFRSGIRVGAWYTVTDGDDITPPGSPDDPYRDKGIFFSIPLSSMLTRDTRATARMSISPWTRDVGQMVKSPGDLYDMLEDPLLFDSAEHSLITGFHE